VAPSATSINSKLLGAWLTTLSSLLQLVKAMPNVNKNNKGLNLFLIFLIFNFFFGFSIFYCYFNCNEFCFLQLQKNIDFILLLM